MPPLTHPLTGGARLFRSSLPPEFHRSVVEDLKWTGPGELGHELRKIPSVPTLLADQVIIREVERMLGAGAQLDGCMHMHLNSNNENGPWHRDDYCGRRWPCPMAILCYFPQNTPPKMGPTEARWSGDSIVASGPAGTCLLMRHDTEHRATANHTGRQRFMLKFLFRLPDLDAPA